MPYYSLTDIGEYLMEDASWKLRQLYEIDPGSNVTAPEPRAPEKPTSEPRADEKLSPDNKILVDENKGSASAQTAAVELKNEPSASMPHGQSSARTISDLALLVRDPRISPADALAYAQEAAQLNDASLREVLGVLSAALQKAYFGSDEMLGDEWAECAELIEMKFIFNSDEKDQGVFDASAERLDAVPAAVTDTSDASHAEAGGNGESLHILQGDGDPEVSAFYELINYYLDDSRFDNLTGRWYPKG
ncbi:MAG: hypothetical protein PUK59_07570 [Actinomycetaceae bacterium]|nr:hypothetical protein [Actinomycetaceae bacterium]MDY5854361.1 hypothetical protein [Arcanobacterium sp.]